MIKQSIVNSLPASKSVVYLAIAVATALFGAGMAQVTFTAEATAACNAMIAALTAPSLVLAVSTVFGLFAAWSWFIAKNQGLTGAVSVVFGAFLMLKHVTVLGWFGFGA